MPDFAGILRRVIGWPMRFLRSLAGSQSKSATDGNRMLLEHFGLQLGDEFLYATSPSAGETKSVNDAISNRIAAMLKECEVQAPADDDGLRRRWEHVYEIERLLIYIRPRNRLAIEVDRRVDEAKRIGLPAGDKYRAQLDAANARLTAARAALANANSAAAAATTAEQPRLQDAAKQAQQHLADEEVSVDSERRAILAAVLDDLQWQYQKNNLVRKALWGSATNLLGFGFVTGVIVGLPFIAFLIERWSGIRSFSNLLDMFPNYGLYTAMSFGLLGAFFSRLTSLKFTTTGLTVEEAENRYSLISLSIRASVGTFGALLFYFLMRTGIIGAIAPDFNKFTYEMRPVQSVLTDAEVLIPSKDWSLLVLYSFLAGFSEKLVPDSLSKVEATVSSQKP